MRRCLVVFLLLCFTAGGCARRSALPPISEIEISAREYAELRASLSACGSTIQTFRGLARVSAHQGSDRSTFRYVLVFEKPDRLRLEAIPTTAVYTLSLLVSAQGQFTYLEPPEKRAVRGAGIQQMLGRYVGIPLEPSDLMAISLGCLPPRYNIQDLRSYRDTERNIIQVVGNGLLLELESGSFATRRLYLISPLDDRTAVEIEWQGAHSPNLSAPFSMQIRVPRHELRVDMNFTSIQHNATISDQLFHPSIPSDYSVRTE